ncbi:MAG: hypothetical protein WCI17_05555 [bacterium]
MPLRPLLLLLLLTGCTTAARAELRLLASATSDSYQSLTFGLSSFCQAAGFPFALTEINGTASEFLLIPNLAGIDVQQRIWLLWLAAGPQDQPEADIVSVAILPTADNAAAALQALTNSYPVVRAEEGQFLFWRYARPPAEPASASGKSVAPVLYVAVRRGTVIVSASREAAFWAASHALPSVPAAASAVAGQVRFEFQPAVLAALLAAEGGDRTESQSRLRNIAAQVMTDIRALTLAVETTTEGVTARLSVSPRPDSRLARLFARIHPPEKSFWQMCPDPATLAMTSGGAGIWQIPGTYEASRTNLPPTAETVLGDCLTGDSAVFIDRMAATNGPLFYAEILGITNRAVAWARAQSAPQALLPFTTSFRFVTNGTRTVLGTPVLDLTRHGFVASADGNRNPADMAAFMVRDGGISLAVTGSCLVMTFGVPGAMEQVLQQLASLPAKPSLPARCRKLLPDLPDAPCSAVLLQPAGLIRQIALSLPGLKPERVAALPLPGDGMAAATTRDADNVLHLTLRASANEISRLQDGMTKGQAALQEMFMQMALQQMLQMDRKLDAPDPRDPR